MDNQTKEPVSTKLFKHSSTKKIVSILIKLKHKPKPYLWLGFMLANQ